MYLKSIPIKIGAQSVQTEFIKLVDKIISITQSYDYMQNPTKQGKVKLYEKEIDQMVYALYGLTPEEIAIVEGKKTE